MSLECHTPPIESEVCQTLAIDVTTMFGSTIRKMLPEHWRNLQNPTFEICLEKLLTMLFEQ
jgi:hypothetical protein